MSDSPVEGAPTARNRLATRSRRCGSTRRPNAIPRLGRFLEAANASLPLKARWHVAQVNAERLEMSDHSWVHLQIVLNRALHLFRMLHRHGLKSSVETDYALSHKDAEVIIAGGCLLHDLGMSIHRIDHEAYSLHIAGDLLDDLLETVYDEPERTVITAEIQHAIIGHRKGGRPLTLEAGVVRVADALDMEQGRSRVSFETSLANIHSLSAAAIDEVKIVPGEQRAVRVEVLMNNSAGRLPGRLAAGLQAARLGPGALHRGRGPDRRRAREAATARLPDLIRRPASYAARAERAAHAEARGRRPSRSSRIWNCELAAEPSASSSNASWLRVERRVELAGLLGLSHLALEEAEEVAHLTGHHRAHRRCRGGCRTRP